VTTLVVFAACRPTATPIPPRAGAIHLGVTGVFSTLEPALAHAPSDRTLHALLYEGLLTFDEALRPVPILADGLPEPSANGLVWTLRCRQDVVFHDGGAFTCADARARLESLQANAAVITGEDVSTVTLRALLERISILALVDDYTLTITLSEPFGYLPEALAHPAAAVIRPDGIGTGPYRLAALTDTEATLEANRAYRRAPLPAETVVLSTLPEDAAWSAATYDAMDTAPIGNTPDGAVLLTTPGTAIILLRFGPDASMASTVAIRRAMSMVIDRAALADQVYDGHARPVMSLIMNIGSESSPATAEALAAARELQAEAGWPDGFDMLVYADSAIPRREILGEALSDQLEALYITGGAARLELAIEPPGFILTMLPFPDSYTALTWLVGADGPAVGDEGLRQIIAEAQAAPTAAEREAALAAARSHLSETLPVITLVALDARALARPDAAVRLSPFGWLEIRLPE